MKEHGSPEEHKPSPNEHLGQHTDPIRTGICFFGFIITNTPRLCRTWAILGPACSTYPLSSTWTGPYTSVQAFCRLEKPLTEQFNS